MDKQVSETKRENNNKTERRKKGTMKISKQTCSNCEKNESKQRGEREKKKVMQFSLVRLFKSLNARPKMFSGGGENGGKVGRDRFSFENSSSRHFPRDNTKFLRSGETGRREREEIRGTIWQRASLAWFRSTFDYPRRRWRSVPRKKDKGRGRTCTFLPLPSSFFLFFFLPFFLPFFFPPLPLPRVQTDHEPISQYNGFQFEMVTK